MKKIIFTIIMLLFTITLIIKPAHALQITDEVVVYQAKLEYSGPSSLRDVSIFNLSFQTQDVQTFDYIYITDLYDMFTNSHLIPAQYYVYAIPNLNLMSLQVYNYSSNNVIHTFNQISYIIFNFDLQTVTFRSDYSPLIPLVLTLQNINSTNTAINLLIQNDVDVYQSGYDVGHDVGYDAGYDVGYDVGYIEGYDYGYDVGYINGENAGHDNGYIEGYDYGYNDARLEYGYFNGSNYLTANEYGQIRYDNAFESTRAQYGYQAGSTWLTAEQYGDNMYDIGYNNGLSNEIDWFSWSMTFFLMPFRIMNIQVLPGVRIGYFALFSLLLGVVGWFFFIVGKGGGRRK